jgi:hypothetical protein
MMLKSTFDELKAISKDLKNDTTRIILLITFIMLLIEYFGWQRPFFQKVAPLLSITGGKQKLTFYAQIHTTLSFLLYFIVIPTLYLKFLSATKTIPALSLPKRKDLSSYALFGVVMLVVLAIACNNPGFYNFYPLYRPNSYSDWVFFELVYLPQFIAVEFFFRGPLLFKLHKELGRLAIIVMTLPYALIHIHKPFPEAIGSIAAGIILGHYALKSKSIWFGVLLHMLIALSADFFGLFYSGTLGRW